MLVSELREKDRYGAFSGFVSISDAKKSGLIPEEYHEVFNDFCECGSERIISVELTKFMCCDPRCPIKIGHSLDYLFGKFGCENIGERTCLTIAKYAYKNLEYKSHISLLNLEDKFLPPSITGMTHYYFNLAVERVKNTKLSFPEMVSKLGIPKFDNTALKILDGIPNSDTLIDIIQKEGGVRNFLFRRHVEDAMKAFYLEEFLYDIAYAEYKVFRGLLPIGKITIPIVMTGFLYIDGIRIHKDDFVSLCNKVGQVTPGLRLFNVQSSTALETASYFIADAATTNSKYLKAKQREALEGRKLIYSSKEFLLMLKSLADKYMEANNLKPKENNEEDGGSSASKMEVFE
jgi:hypothetical protein